MGGQLILEKFLIRSTKMYGDDPRCKVCRATCDRQGYNTHRSCGSCQQFYYRSVRMMQSSSSFQYYCTCVSRCESRIVKCDIDSKNRNACKQCRYVKYTNS